MRKHFREFVNGKDLANKLDEIVNEKAGTTQEIHYRHNFGDHIVIWYIDAYDDSVIVVSDDMKKHAWPSWYQEHLNTYEAELDAEAAVGYIDAAYSHGGVLKKVSGEAEGKVVVTVVVPEEFHKHFENTVLPAKPYAAEPL